MNRPIPKKTSGLNIIQPLTIAYNPSKSNINLLFIELATGMTSKSEAIECMVGIDTASKVRWPCFLEKDAMNNLKWINISAIEIGSLTIGTLYTIDIRTVGADDGVNGFLLPAGS